MRSIILLVAAVALTLTFVVSSMLSSSDARNGIREGQHIGMSDAGQHNADTFNEVKGWLSELD